jgi:CBS domain containing-hemolysin-like protein
MGIYVAIIISSFAALLVHMLHHAYFYLPLKEMKRRAAHGKQSFRGLVLVAKYEASAHVFFDFFKFLLTVTTFVIIARNLHPVSAGVLIFILIVGLSYASRLNSKLAVRLAVFLSPYIEPALRKLQPLLAPIGKVMGGVATVSRSDIYEKEDLKELLRHQKTVPNNRIKEDELTRALYALDFGSKKIQDYMVGYDDIHFVTTKEPIGPILLSELHRSGYSCFPVQGNAKHEVVGMLRLDHLADHTSGGTVGSVMDSLVHYVPTDEHLEFVLESFARTGAHVYMVSDAGNEVIGLISIDDILAQLLGHALVSESTEDEDPEA